MRFRPSICLALALLFVLVGCQSAPPTVMVLVVTSTPDTSTQTESTTGAAQSLATPTQELVTSTPAPTPTTDPFPTPTVGQLQVAEQPFEKGRMFWIQPRAEIWVLMADDEKQTHGTWAIYQDTFLDGEAETDPSIIPPNDDEYQPARGFGKLWRESQDIRDALGWATTPMEFGYVSRYEYHPGGSVSGGGAYTPGPGYHLLFSLYEQAYRLNESDKTWQLGRGDDSTSS